MLAMESSQIGGFVIFLGTRHVVPANLTCALKESVT